MKKYLLLFLLLIFSIAFAQTVTNTFENVSDLDNFSQTSPACDSPICNASLSTDVAHSGTQSLKFSVDDNSGLDQWLIYTYALPLNDSNNFSVWINLPDNKGIHYLQFDIFCDNRPNYIYAPQIFTGNFNFPDTNYALYFGDSLSYSYECDNSTCLNKWYKLQAIRNGSSVTTNYFDSSNNLLFTRTMSSAECTPDQNTYVDFQFDPNYSAQSTTNTFSIYLDDFSYDNAIPEITNTGCGTRCGSGAPINSIINTGGSPPETTCKNIITFAGFSLTTCNFWILFVLLLLILAYSATKKRRR